MTIANQKTCHKDTKATMGSKHHRHSLYFLPNLHGLCGEFLQSIKPARPRPGHRPPKPTRMVPVTVEMIGPELKLPVVMPHNLVAW
jgi:hypothetical protein